MTKGDSSPAPKRNPITGVDGCARAASGHATAPPSSVMNARRFIWPPPRLNQNDRLGTYHIELAPYVRRFTNKEPWNIGVQWLAGEVRSGSNSEELNVSKCFPVCPRKRTPADRRVMSQKGLTG